MGQLREKSILLIVVLFTICMANGQSGFERTVEISENSEVYDFESKRLLLKEEVSSNLENGVFEVKEYDSKGEALSLYLIDGLKSGNGLDKRDYLTPPVIDEALPPFTANAYQGNSISSEEFLGKPLVLMFGLMLQPPFDTKLDEGLVLQEDDNIQMILFVSYEIDGSEPLMQADGFKIPIIPNSAGFADKYYVFSFPSYLLIDSNGHYKGSFREVSDLREMIAKL